MNRIFELCDNSVMLFMLGKNLQRDGRAEWREHKVSASDGSAGTLSDARRASNFRCSADTHKWELIVAINLLEHILYSYYCVAVGEAVFFRRIRELFVHDDDVFRQRDAAAQQVVETIDRAEHPIDQRKVRNCV